MTSAPARAGTGPSPFTRRRAAAVAPSRHSDFRGCFERCRGTSHRSAAARCFDGAAACQVLLRWVVAATPRPLRASRAGGATTCRHRIRGVCRGRNMRSSCSAPRPARSRVARVWEAPRGGSAAPTRLAARRCARCTSAQAHPLTDSRPSPAAQRPRHSDRRWQPRRRCPQRGAGGAGAPARTALGAGSRLPRARGESSTRPAARPSASAGSCLLPAGSQASRKASADCA